MTPAFPQVSSPLVDTDTGIITSQWRGFFQWVWGLRTVVATGLVSAGLDQSSATPLTGDWNEVVSGPGGGGVIMSALAPGDNPVFVVNLTGTNLNIFPIPNAQIDTLGVNAPYVLAPGKTQTFRQFTNTQVYSDQPG